MFLANGATGARRTGIVLSVCVLLVVFVATLTPSSDASSASFWCVPCGEFGGLDVLNNIVLFLPLGFAFALASGHRWRSVLACVAVTAFIEAMQVRVVPGRDSSLSDLLANSLGGLLGVELAVRRALLVRPRGRSATVLAAAGAGAFGLVTTLTSIGLRPASIPRNLWLQWTPERESFVPFTGQLLDFKVNDVALPRSFWPPKSLRLDRMLANPVWHVTVTLETAGIRARRSVIARIAEEYTVLVSIEQHGWDLTCEEKTRSSDFLFRSPRVSLPDALAPSGLTPSRLRFTCAREGNSLVAAIGDRQEVLRLSPSLGWRLLDPFALELPRYLWFGAIWLMALAFPAGYWIGCCTQDHTEDATHQQSSARPSVAIGALAIAFLIGLLIVPVLAGAAPAAWWEWVSAAVGAVAGSGAAWLWKARVARLPIRHGGASVSVISDPVP